MADPLTLSLIAANCAWGLVTGPFGNRADAALTAAARRLAKTLSESQTPENHDILKATHKAWVLSVQAIVALSASAITDYDERLAQEKLARLVGKPEFTELRFVGAAIPLNSLEAIIAEIYRVDTDPDGAATDATIARIEQLLGFTLPPVIRAVFHSGHAGKRGWAQTFQLFFSEAVKTNERVFRELMFERLNEVIARVEANAGILATLHQLVSDFWRGVAEQLARIEAMVADLHQDLMARRGAQVAEAEINERAVLSIARKIAENVADAGQALAELDAAVDELLALRADAERGSNLDQLVEDALRRIDERARNGEFDAAAREAAEAFAQWEAREAERREREKAIGIKFADENIRTNRLRRDAEAVAQWIIRRAMIEHGVDKIGYGVVAAEIEKLIESGRDRGINLDLEVAATLADAGNIAVASDSEGAALSGWLGTALATLGEREEGTASLDAAVTAYRAALEVYMRDRLPLDWAMTQNNLGNALGALGEREEGTASLEAAVTAYRAALEVYTRDRLPLDWAMTQNNLGNALATLGERAEGTASLDAAVTAYRAALEIYTRDRLPLDWAMTQHNLGTVLQTLGAREEGTASLEAAVTAYRAALEVRTRDRLPLQWAMTQNNLGNALRTLGAREEGTASLEAAVTAYRAALEVRTRDRLPLQWATTQNNLGAALQTLGAREEGTASLDAAVTAYRAALEVRTRDRLPLDWAMTQNNLGNALRALGEREEGTASLEAAVTAYRAALEVRARDRLPLDWAATSLSLILARALIHERGGAQVSLASLREDAIQALTVLIDGGHAQWAGWGRHVIAQIDRIAGAA